MEKYQVESFGAFGLKLRDCQPEIPGPGEVLVNLQAASVNYRDLLMLKGLYNKRQPLPYVPLSDGTGVIEALGTGVLEWKVGQRVCPIFAQNWLTGPMPSNVREHTLGAPLDGTLRTQGVFSEDSLVAVPDYLSPEEAATLPCAGVTAYRALFELYDLKQEDVVVIQGTGGVALMALQFAKAVGATVIITSSSDEKLRRAQNLGADFGINYRKKEAWSKEVREMTEGLGATFVLELGGANTLKESLKCLRLGGHIAMIGVLAGAGNFNFDVRPILMQQIRIQGVFVGHKGTFLSLMTFLEKHQISPQIEKVFSFARAPQAFETLESQKHFGKVCIQI